MTVNLQAEKISKALFESDPMNTCCKENNCYTEYDDIAEGVSKRLKIGQNLATAIEEQISHCFYDGNPFDTVVLRSVIDELNGVENAR
jgi:hypothetical protein